MVLYSGNRAIQWSFAIIADIYTYTNSGATVGLDMHGETFPISRSCPIFHLRAFFPLFCPLKCVPLCFWSFQQSRSPIRGTERFGDFVFLWSLSGRHFLLIVSGTYSQTIVSDFLEGFQMGGSLQSQKYLLQNVQNELFDHEKNLATLCPLLTFLLSCLLTYLLTYWSSPRIAIAMQWKLWLLSSSNSLPLCKVMYFGPQDVFLRSHF